MSSSGISEPITPNPVDDQQVIEFLRARPEFLEQYPQLIAELSVPHESGTAVSLVERQISALRAENTRLKQQLERLLVTARQNEKLNSNIHALALNLMNAIGPEAVFARLEQCLSDDFGADHVAARVFADASMVDAVQVPQFVGADSAMREPFVTLLSSQITSCGQLTDARHEALFNDIGGRLSAVLMPLAGHNWDGVLAIASTDAERYQADMGTEFLTYLKDVVALVIDPWVRREPGA